LHKDAVADEITGAIKKDAIKKSPCIVQEDFFMVKKRIIS